MNSGKIKIMLFGRAKHFEELAKKVTLSYIEPKASLVVKVYIQLFIALKYPGSSRCEKCLLSPSIVLSHANTVTMIHAFPKLLMATH